MKTSYKIISLATILLGVLATAGLVFAKSTPLPPRRASCGTYRQWTKVFEGNYSTSTAAIGDRWYGLTVSRAITHPTLQALVRKGCDFKLIDDSAGGGGSGPTGYECSLVSAIAGPSDVTPLTNTFSCITAIMAGNGFHADGYSVGKRLIFQSGLVYIQKLENEGDFMGPSTFSLFVKK